MQSKRGLSEIPAVLRYRIENFPDDWKIVVGPLGWRLYGPTGFMEVFHGEEAATQARRRAWELHDDANSKETMSW